jgi:hypothetical protein
MKKLYLLFILFAFFPFQKVLSQDTLILKNGDELKTKVLFVTPTEINYKKFDNLNGPTITISKSDVFMIKYQSGIKEVIKSTPYNNTEVSKSNRDADSKPNRFGIYADPLGFVQFGPRLGLEATLFSHLIIDGHVRFATLGLLMPVISKNDDGVSPYKLNGMGVGGGLKYLVTTNSGGFYFGAICEKAWQTHDFYKDEKWASESEIAYLAVVSNLGYKFRFESGFYINTGIYLGGAFLTKSQWRYTSPSNSDQSIHYGDLVTRVFGMVELSFGFDF